MKHTRISSIAMGAALTASVIAAPLAALAHGNEAGKGNGPDRSRQGLVHIELNGKVAPKPKNDKPTPGHIRNGKWDEAKVLGWIAFLQSWLANHRANASSTPPVNHPKPPHATTTPPVASTTPVIRDITASFGSRSIRIAWNSSSPADGAVFYSTSSPVVIGAASTQVSASSGLTKQHSFNLTGLATSTPYYFLIQSKNQAGTTTSSQFSLTTLNI